MRGATPRRPQLLRGDLLGALIAHCDMWGSWPNGSDWERASPEHPPRRTYVRRFGSWLAAIEAAERERNRRTARLTGQHRVTAS